MDRTGDLMLRVLTVGTIVDRGLVTDLEAVVSMMAEEVAVLIGQMKDMEKVSKIVEVLKTGETVGEQVL